MSNNVHIVQLSFDKDSFNEHAPQDSRSRQISYAKYLDKMRPGAKLTNVVLTTDRSLHKEDISNLTLDPQNFYRIRHIYKLFKYLRMLHEKDPITLLTTQDYHGIFWAGLFFGRLSRVPVVGQHHCDLASPYSREHNLTKRYGRLYRMIALNLVKSFDGLRVVNSEAKRFLQKLGCKQRIEVLPVPSLTFKVDDKTDQNTKRNKKILRVLFAGRFVKFKNLECWMHTAEQALRSDKNIEFFLIGDGVERESLEKLRDELELQSKVHFVGALTPKQLAEWYSTADVFLLTSMYEGFGRVIVESMNYGMVPVCSNVSGPRDIIQHGVNGYLAEADPKALSELLVELAKNSNKRFAMSKNAINTAKGKYSPEKLKKDWVNFLLSFISK